MYHPRPSIFTKRPSAARPSLRSRVRTPSLLACAAALGSKKPSVTTRLSLASGLLPAAPEISPEPLALPLHISSSSIALWRACRRKWYWSKLQSLAPTGSSVHLIAGGAVAAGLEAARKRVFSAPDPQSIGHTQLLEAALPAYLEAWGSYEPPDNPRNAKTVLGTFYALSDYLSAFHPARDPVQPLRRPDGTPTIEYKFAVPIPVEHPSGDPFLFIGRFDLFGTYSTGTSEEFLTVLDEKTTSSFTMGWADSWSLSGQFMGYIWALQQEGYDIDHCVVRGIAIQKVENKFQTALLQYPKFLLTRWYDQLCRDVTEMRDTWIAFQRNLDTPDMSYPYNLSESCTAYGGCAFAQLCSTPDPADFLSNYTLHRYNAFAQQPVEEVPLP